MPKKVAKKPITKKQKLTPEQRSQVAKDRWAKRRATLEAIEASPAAPDTRGVEVPDMPGVITKLVDGLVTVDVPVKYINFNDLNHKVPPEKRAALTQELSEQLAAEENNSPSVPPEKPPVSDALKQLQTEMTANAVAGIKASIGGSPALQQAPAVPKKQKRYTGPKEFSVALKAAETRLAKAIEERAKKNGELAALNAEIPSLVQIIHALKGSSSPVPQMYSGTNDVMNPFQPPQSPLPTYPYDPGQAAMQAAGIIPVSRAVGNAVQFGPADLGVLEGPEDDDPDKFLRGEHAGGGWIGG